MLSIGVTGGLGSGKSAAIKIFYEMGANILNADDIAKNILKVDRNINKTIKNTFGDDCYIDGELQTAVLADRAFNNFENLQKLNDISHPALKQHLGKYIAATRAVPGILMVEAAILLEAGYKDIFDKVLLVTANEDIRMQRATERKNITEESIKERISLQMPESEKRNHADFVIENNGVEDQFRDACKAFWEEINLK